MRPGWSAAATATFRRASARCIPATGSDPNGQLRYFAPPSPRGYTHGSDQNHGSAMRLPMMTLCLAAAFAVTGCSREAAPAGPASAPEGRADPVAAVVEHDPFSYAEPARVRIEDLALELAMDFDARTLSGSATYTLDWRDENARELVLDTRDLAIDKVVGERGDGKWQDLEYSLAEADPRLGSKLTIQAPD